MEAFFTYDLLKEGKNIFQPKILSINLFIDKHRNFNTNKIGLENWLNENCDQSVIFYLLFIKDLKIAILSVFLGMLN